MWTFQKQLLLLSRQDWCPEHVNSLCLRNVGNYRPSLVTAQQETVVLVQITVITSIHIKALVYAGNCLVVYCSASVPCEVLICWIHKLSGIRHRADWWIVTDISEEIIASIFRVVFLDSSEGGQQFSPMQWKLFTSLHDVVPGGLNLNTDMRPSYTSLNFFSPILVAAQSKTWVCGRLLAEIAGSNPTGCHGCLLWLLCVVR